MHHSTLSWNFQEGGKTQMMSESPVQKEGWGLKIEIKFEKKKEKKQKMLPERRENKGGAEQRERQRDGRRGGQVQIVNWVKQWVTDSPERVGCENKERVEHSAVVTEWQTHICLSVHVHTHMHSFKSISSSLFLRLIHKNGWQTLCFCLHGRCGGYKNSDEYNGTDMRREIMKKMKSIFQMAAEKKNVFFVFFFNGREFTTIIVLGGVWLCAITS